MKYPLENWEKVKRGYRFGQKTFYTEHHLGVDYIVPEGTLIYAPIDCEIIVSDVFRDGGNTFHACFSDSEYGKLIMRCMHMRQLSSKGFYKEGDILGYTGNTGKYTTAPHLHLDISKNAVKIKEFNNFIDPEEFFSKRVNKTNNMITYKKDGEDMIYVLVGNILIPFETSCEIYKQEFKSAEIKYLLAEEFNKFKVSETVRIVSR